MATSVIKPNNAGVDLPISLPTTGWSSNQWTYSNSAITADCAIEVEFKDGTLNTNVPYIEYEKASGGGGIVFTVPSVPTVAIPVIAHVYFMQNGSFTTAVDTAITTTGGAESLGANVSSALAGLEKRTNFDNGLNVATDANSAPYGFSQINGDGANIPAAARFVLFTAHVFTEYYKIQLALADNGAGLFIRNYDESLVAWGAWRKLAFET